jgi:hypothetical protein
MNIYKVVGEVLTGVQIDTVYILNVYRYGIDIDVVILINR